MVEYFLTICAWLALVIAMLQIFSGIFYIKDPGTLFKLAEQLGYDPYIIVFGKPVLIALISIAWLCSYYLHL